MANRKHTLLLGYARRMEEVARLAGEMRDIQEQYRSEFGEWEHSDLVRVLTGDRMARLRAGLAAERPEQPQEPSPEGSQAATVAPGSALGLVPAPQWLQDGLGDELTTAERIRLDSSNRIDREDWPISREAEILMRADGEEIPDV